MEFSCKTTSLSPSRAQPPAREAGPGGHLSFEPRSSADPTAPGGDLPEEVFQTWVTGGRVQDSSTPQQMSLSLSAAAARALSRAADPGLRTAERVPAPDEAGGDVGHLFRVVLLRGDLKVIEAWDAVACDYAPLQLPQSTFSFHRLPAGRVQVEMKRKHLPPSKNHGDVFFRLAVQLLVDVDGARPVAASSAFRIFSKQSTAGPRPEPKRRRNPAPTKPFVAPFAPCDGAVLAALHAGAPQAAAAAAAAAAPCAGLAAAPAAASAAAPVTVTVTASAAAAPVDHESARTPPVDAAVAARAPKRRRESTASGFADLGLPTSAERDGDARKWGPLVDEDCWSEDLTSSDSALSPLGRGYSSGSGSIGHADVAVDCEPAPVRPRLASASAVAMPVELPPPYHPDLTCGAGFTACAPGPGVPMHGVTVAEAFTW